MYGLVDRDLFSVGVNQSRVFDHHEKFRVPCSMKGATYGGDQQFKLSVIESIHLEQSSGLSGRGPTDKFRCPAT